MLIANWQLLTVEQPSEADRLMPDWQDLARRSVVPAGPAAPELLIPMLRHVGGAELFTVRAGDDLVLALPLARRRLPSVWATWLTPIGNSGLVHLDCNLGSAGIAAVLHKTANPLLLTGIPADGPFWDTLEASGSRFAVLERWQRAALRPPTSFEDWFEGNFDRKRRKEYRRLRCRLAETGRLESVELAHHDDPRQWAIALLDLEERGWKGKRGTAIAQHEKVVTGFHEVCTRLHEAKKLRFWALRLDGRTIATLYAIVEGGQAWLGKIAYDEAFAKFSPGVLLILDATRSLISEGGIANADSCAIPNHPMIDNIWRDRLAVADVMIGAADGPAYRFAVTVAIERLRRRLRSIAKATFHKLTGSRRS
jgi:CelD/BcsL family acetyltransferase involved in cellulose biosynthesis